MSKLVINNISSGYTSTTALNTAFTAIEEALENTLSRDGTSPNQMNANLDMNGYAILNARATTGNENFIWLGTWTTGTVYAVNNLVYAPEGSNIGNTLICVTAHTAGATLDGDAAKWAIFAQRGASGAGTGDVNGPASSTADSLARFNGTTGKLLKDGAIIGTDVQAYSANLAALSVLSTGTGSGNIPLVGTKSATESLAGLVEIATQAEAEAGTDDTVVLSSLKTAQAITKQAFNGSGYTRNFYTSPTRAKATTYTNNTGYPLFVYVTMSDASGGITFLINGNIAEAAGSGSTGANFVVGGMVLPLETYRVNGNGSIAYWSEISK